MNVLEKYNPITYPKWNDILLDFTEANIFHTSNWANVLMESYGYKTSAYIVKFNNEIQFVLPITDLNTLIAGKKGVSVAFSDYCPPLFKSGFDDNLLLQKIILIGNQNKWKSIEFRGKSKLIKNDLTYSIYHDHTIFLNTSYEHIRTNYRKNYLSKINKAKKEGLEVSYSKSLNALLEYYKLHCITRKRQGMIPQPLNFFNSIYKNIIEKNLGFVVLITKKNVPVAGAVFFNFNNKLLYKFGASDLKYKELCANYLLFDEIIQWALKNDLKEFSLGRTELDNEGLLQFKRGWAVKETLIKYFKYDLKNGQFIQNENLISSFHGAQYLKKMPVPFLKLAGNILYKHAG